MLTPEQAQAVEDLSEGDLAIIEDVKRRLGASALELQPSAPIPSDSDQS